MVVYQKIEADMYSAKALLSLLKNKNVLLEVWFDTFDMTCSVTSYAYSDTMKKLCVYQATHYLATRGSRYEENVVVECSADWTEKFLREDTYIGIEHDSFSRCEYASDLEQIKNLLSKLNQSEESSWQTELYLSGDYGNFCGPLECHMIEWWIANHKGYHTDTISTKVADFEITENGTLLEYTGKNEVKVSVPDGVKRIGEGAFRFCKVKHIVLPEGLLSIESSAFDQGRALEMIEIPSSVVQIGEFAFCECSNLRSVVIPPSVKRIKPYTFSGCRMLNTVVLPPSIEIIGEKAFQECSELKEIQLPESLEEIERQAFSDCINLSHVVLSKETRVGYAAFAGCSSEVETLSNNFVVLKGRLVEASHSLKLDVQVPDDVRILVEDPHRNVIFGGKTLYDNTKIRTLLLPKRTIKAERMTLPKKMEYLVIRPGKRNFLCEDNILDRITTKMVFHFGRNFVMESSYRWCDEPLVFVSFPSDQVLLSPNNEPLSDDTKRYRLLVENIHDIKKIIEQYHLQEIPAIISYLSEIFCCDLN